VTRFLVRNNGTFNQGYGVLVVRSDQNFDNSQVILVEDNAQLASIPSTFQYGPEIHISVTFNLDGSITGTVSEPAPSTNTFRFSFGPHAIQSTGDNFSIAVECSSGPVDQRIDDVVITETLSDCETTLPFGWPTASGAGQVSQDYAEFDGSAASRRTQEVCNPTTGVCQLLVKPHYHTGMDLASPVSVTEPDRSQQVFAAGRGEIVAVCPNVPGGCEFDGTRFSRPDTNDNHGLQGAVILKHTVTESNMVYSLYAHLGTTEAFQPGECIEQGTLIGATGGLPDGHLHFEVKSAPVLSNPLTAPGTCIDPGTKKPSAVCFGYTLVNPNTRAYFDPVEYLHLLDKSGFPKAVILSDRKDKKIKADSGPGAFGDAYPVVGKAEQGTYTALSKVFGATTDPSCADSWYQIWHASNDCSVLGNCFTQNAKSTKDSVPEAWVCSDFVKE
jgi:murein DD-endopeptidase MepM/ murein hydrolase activator NlpD